MENNITHSLAEATKRLDKLERLVVGLQHQNLTLRAEIRHLKARVEGATSSIRNVEARVRSHRGE